MKMIIVKCAQCGKEYEKKAGLVNYALKFGRKHYCSKECQSKAKIKKVAKRCANCGKNILVRLSDLSKSKTGNSFCNHRCAGLYSNRDKSPIWKVDYITLLNAVKSSKNFSEILKRLGFGNKSSHLTTLKNRLQHDKIEFSPVYVANNTIPLNDACTENSSYHRRHLKRRLLEAGILKNQCSICGMEDTWQGKPIVHIIDHINGINNDNRIENLRLVCPCCNSQLSTFAGRNVKHKQNHNLVCPKCGGEKYCEAKLCNTCFGFARRKVNRPTLDVLLNEIKTEGYSVTGRKYGVSDGAIKKWVKGYGAPLP